eukprot:TRINITY_DN3306_c1_g6_i1.p2 TRINITY_DN3306_c1_g6~~TRINITY_DN3306_c1_g6_i1.p2  ORF type:complete len:147 (-),score=41.64 TRINITY_DN3306_c1_g6_i1:112-552(-)
MKGHTELVEFLLEKNADMSLCCDEISPLYIACFNEYSDIVRKLLDYGPNNNGWDINKCNNDITPLHERCYKGNYEIAELLANAGADLNLCVVRGKSPCYICWQKGNFKMLEMLMKKGAKFKSEEIIILRKYFKEIVRRESLILDLR